MIVDETRVETMYPTSEFTQHIHVIHMYAACVFSEIDIAKEINEANAVFELVVRCDGADPELAAKCADNGTVGVGKVGQECCEFVLHKRSPFCECMEYFRTRMC